ncbi:hypothetical protein EZH22_11050 [Xanthobacter dioxanivorans]|uniref:Uncharacterized protein n=1 Tax=Xanthobacter dioxanivorans TaxID=2528964 RepID=A0A974PSU8_9HYPH|nr:hypothetical protein [Xanthobacter dioxanivorans]QRG08764.1 hypothetical protein EZH22_11050 [Xanthobacter dioxanivorans]
MSHVPFPDGAATAGAGLYRLVVEAEPDPNSLLRLLEPFVIHDVLPHRIDCASTAEACAVELEFTATADLATRLHMRLSTLVCVRDAALAPAAAPIAGALGAAA